MFRFHAQPATGAQHLCGEHLFSEILRNLQREFEIARFGLPFSFAAQFLLRKNRWLLIVIPGMPPAFRV